MLVTPLAKEFGWGRAKNSVLTSAIALMSGMASPLAGWMLKYIMAAGVAVAKGGYVSAGEANSLSIFLCAHILVGIGMGTAGLVSASMVVADLGRCTARFCPGGDDIGRFDRPTDKRSGCAARDRVIGPARRLRTAVATDGGDSYSAVTTDGETRSPMHGAEKRLSVKEASALLPGLEVGEALRSSSAWLLLLGTFCFWFAVNPTETHLIPYLIGLGYSQTTPQASSVCFFPV
jgi:hypothetical protein